jgi:probable HAF family extracellular repeat protein
MQEVTGDRGPDTAIERRNDISIRRPLILSATLVLIARLAAAQSYSLLELAPLGGRDSFGTGINTAAGQVVGYSDTTGNVARHATVWPLVPPTVPLDLGTIGGSAGNSYAWGINAAGHVVGESSVPEGAARHAFLYRDGVMTDLGTLGGTNSVAGSINDADQIVGWSDIAGDSEQHAFLYSGGTMTDLGTFGGTISIANDINNAGVVVGVSLLNGDAVERAFRYQGGSLEDLGTLGGSASDATSIDDLGRIVGNAAPPDDVYRHAFLYGGATMTDLGTLGGMSSAEAINSSGQVVGSSQPGGGYSKFVYDENGMRDLNTLIPPASGWQLTSTTALDIGDDGQIVGTGYRSFPHALQRALLLTPIVGGTTTTSVTTTSSTTSDPVASTTTSSSTSSDTTSSTSSSTTSSTSTSSSTTTLPAPLCAPAPATCQPAFSQRSSVTLTKGTTPASNRLTWKWRSSSPVAAGDFGDPTATAGYAVCVYDQVTLVMTATARAAAQCSGRACWTLASTGAKYKNGALLPDGLLTIVLKAGGAGHAKINVRGKCVNLPIPVLPLATQVTVQLVRGDTGACWDATYGDARVNTATKFKARSDP